MSDWKVAKERTFSHHKYWVVRFRGKRVGAYLTWGRAIDHVMTCHRKFGF